MTQSLVLYNESCAALVKINVQVFPKETHALPLTNGSVVTWTKYLKAAQELGIVISHVIIVTDSVQEGCQLLSAMKCHSTFTAFAITVVFNGLDNVSVETLKFEGADYVQSYPLTTDTFTRTDQLLLMKSNCHKQLRDFSHIVAFINPIAKAIQNLTQIHFQAPQVVDALMDLLTTIGSAIRLLAQSSICEIPALLLPEVEKSKPLAEAAVMLHRLQLSAEEGHNPRKMQSKKRFERRLARRDKRALHIALGNTYRKPSSGCIHVGRHKQAMRRKRDLGGTFATESRELGMST